MGNYKVCLGDKELGFVNIDDSGSGGAKTYSSQKIIDLLNEKANSSHTHGNITSAGAVGSTANLPLITTTSGKITTGSFGTAANTFCQGNDSRLSDSRNAKDVYSWAKASAKPSYTKSEVGLGNVVNTGDSATPVSGGTTKFTTGGAYTELAKKVNNSDACAYKYYGSPSGSTKYITITFNDTYGGIIITTGYNSNLFIEANKGTPYAFNSSTAYGLTGYAWSSDGKILYLKVANYRPIAITIPSIKRSEVGTVGNTGVKVNFSDWSSTTPSGITFLTKVNTIDTVSDRETAVAKKPEVYNNGEPISQGEYDALTAEQKKGKLILVSSSSARSQSEINDNVNATDTTWSSNKIQNNLNSALTNFKPKSIVTTNGIYLKLPRKKDGYYLSYLVTAGGFEAEVTQGFVYKKYANTQWQNIIADIKTDTDYTYLKFNSGWSVSVHCIQAPTQTLTITQTLSSTEFDNAPNQGEIKSI